MKMKKKTLGSAIGVMLGILLVILLYGISWLATCGIIKLITMCFGLNFTWKIATGIWLVICLLKPVFNVTVKNK